MKELRKLARHGNSIHVSIAMRFLNYLRWQPGDAIVVELTERNTLELRPMTAADGRAHFVPMRLPDADVVGVK